MDTTTKAAMDAFGTAMRAGQDLLGAMLRPSMGMLTDQLSSARAAAAKASGCSCEIPEPCWMPKRLPEVTSHACPGSRAKVRLRVTNCGMDKRTITVTVQGSGAASVTVKPKSLTIDPFDTGEFTAAVKVPDDDAELVRAQLWVHGCRDHVLPWQVTVSDCGCGALHEIDIEDCPDLVHHWYDHFYCQRSCHGGRTQPHG